jgi:quercetin 2,3-dioxygenase
MSSSAVLNIFQLGFPWQTSDPFLFCVYHQDFYPKGNAQFGPATSLEGREIGQDFTLKDGWRMYHGQEVPGFPGHPHRGFETITVVEKGLVDHADSQGAAGRYGGGDVQWMTAGKGLQHSEMFPLLQSGQENPTELFQIWLNLPKANKLVAPHFRMFWAENIPQIALQDSAGKNIQLKLVAGALDGLSAPLPPPDSWAADPKHEVAVWVIALEAGAQWELPAAQSGLMRTLYFFEGQTLQVADQSVACGQGVTLDPSQAVNLHNGEQNSRLLLLQGRPIAEPVAQYGPFVMNTRAEIAQAFEDYQVDQFGGWPWPSSEPVHGQRGRFARYADGREEVPEVV